MTERLREKYRNMRHNGPFYGYWPHGGVVFYLDFTLAVCDVLDTIEPYDTTFQDDLRDARWHTQDALSRDSAGATGYIALGIVSRLVRLVPEVWPQVRELEALARWRTCLQDRQAQFPTDPRVRDAFVAALEAGASSFARRLAEDHTGPGDSHKRA